LIQLKLLLNNNKYTLFDKKALSCDKAFFIPTYMLQRDIPPFFTTDFSISLEPAETSRLNGNIPTHVLKSSTIEVFRLEVIYPVGLLNAPNLETGHFITRLMALGTHSRSALQIAEDFEKLGGFFDINLGNFKTTFTLHGMSKYFEQYLPVLLDVIYNSTFPSSEIEIQKKQAEQSHLINAKKSAFVAQREFKEVLYGAASLMGQTLNLNQIQRLNKEELSAFHTYALAESSFEIYICGNVTDTQLKNLEEVLSGISSSKKLATPDFPEKRSAENRTVSLEDSVQSTLTIGKRLFNRTHPDFHKFLVTNTVFGGYFGSRLMKNIREDKGLTYGISSSLVSNLVDGVFSIKADLNKEKLDEAISEVHKEIICLKTEPVSESELSTVKNYIKGNILNGTNTIFDIMDKHKAIATEGLPEDFYETLSDKIQSVTQEDIIEMANKHLNDFSTIIAG
jgi:zinc protease